MRHMVIAMLAGLVLAACSKDRPERSGTTTTTGAGEEARTPTVEEVRVVMMSERPEAAAAIDALEITNVSGVVTLRGHVGDEQAKKALVERVKRMPGVKEVKDEVMVAPVAVGVAPGHAGHAGHADHPAQQVAPGKDSTHTPRIDAIRERLKKGSKTEAVADRIVLTDDGSMVIVSGAVPDQATREAVMKVVRGAPDVTNVKDEMKIAK